MKRIYDFECPKGHRFERFIDSEVRKVSCNICKQESTRLVSCTTFVLDHISGDYPTATTKWAKMREEKIKAERKVASA